MTKPCIGIIKSYDPRPGHCCGRIWMEGNHRHVTFDFAELQDIEQPEAGMKVVFRRKKDRAVSIRLWKPRPEQQPEDADGGLPAA